MDVEDERGAVDLLIVVGVSILVLSAVFPFLYRVRFKWHLLGDILCMISVTFSLFIVYHYLFLF